MKREISDRDKAILKEFLQFLEVKMYYFDEGKWGEWQWNECIERFIKYRDREADKEYKLTRRPKTEIELPPNQEI